YILSVVIHDWDDEPASAILTSCRRAMSGSSRLLLVERVLPDDPGGEVWPYLSDLNMMHNLTGRERSDTPKSREGGRLKRPGSALGPFQAMAAGHIGPVRVCRWHWASFPSN